MPKIFRCAAKKGWGGFNISQNLWKKGWDLIKGRGFNMNAPVPKILGCWTDGGVMGRMAGAWSP